MALHQVKVMRGPDFEDGQPVAVLQYRLPSGQEGLVILDQIEIMGEHMLVDDATDEQIIERCKAYAGGRPFLIDLLNEQHIDANGSLLFKAWLHALTTIYEGEMYLFGVGTEV